MQNFAKKCKKTATTATGQAQRSKAPRSTEIGGWSVFLKMNRSRFMCLLASAWLSLKTLETIRIVACSSFQRTLAISLFVALIPMGEWVKNGVKEESRTAAAWLKNCGTNHPVVRACLSLIRSPGVSTNISRWTVLGITTKAGASMSCSAPSNSFWISWPNVRHVNS